MEIVNIHEAKTRLSKLLQQVSEGEPFIIAKAGRPIAKVVAVDTPEPDHARRLGFLSGEIDVPEDFDRMLVAQAEPEGALLLTSGEVVACYPGPVRWV